MHFNNIKGVFLNLKSWLINSWFI